MKKEKKTPSSKQSSSNSTGSNDTSKSSNKPVNDKRSDKRGLSEEILEKRREERKQMFGSWSGKTPLSMLYEHCQKNQWEKPNIYVNRSGKAFKCDVVLGKKDKKTSTIKTVRFSLQSRTFEAEQTARHFGATFALHRVNHATNIRMLLPPDHRDFWNELEEERKSLGEKAKYIYLADPFVDIDALKQKEAASTKSQDSSSSLLLSSSKKKLKREFPVLDISMENRQLIENLLRDNNVDALFYNQDSASVVSSSDRQIILKSLMRMGFRKQHVDEALQWSHDQTGALNWLCVHVPEDDLPQSILSSRSNSRKITIQQHNSDTLAQEYTIKRLLSIGFSRDQIEAALYENDKDEILALECLWKRLMSDILLPVSIALNTDREDVRHIRRDEFLALESIFAEDFVLEEGNVGHTLVSLTISIAGMNEALILDTHISKHCQYPYELPVFVIRCEKLPAYLKIAIMKELTTKAVDMVGEPMLYLVKEWLEENAKRIIDHPPSLLKISDNLNGSSLQKGAKRQKNENEKVKVKSEIRGVRGGVARKALNRNAVLDEKMYLAFKGLKTTKAYQMMYQNRCRLPAHSFRDNIIEAVNNNQVVILCGETGCGKSTQTPQYILENMIDTKRGSICNIFCTQPRRISAISLAERVSSELTERCGLTVGYSIRGENKQSASTRLWFVTTGILLRKLHSDPLLSDVSHIVVDEVHERGVESDFLLAILKSLLKRRLDLKVILMSATINSTVFSSYFGSAPVLEIPGFTFPVNDYYLEDVLKLTEFVPFIPSKRSFTKTQRRQKQNAIGSSKNLEVEDEFWECYEKEGYSETTISAIQYLDEMPERLDYDLISATVKFIIKSDQSNTGEYGAILIFLPGVMEIKSCIENLELSLSSTFSREVNQRFVILPLHSNLTSVEQSRIFTKMKSGARKIVVSTNVAETSITIDDVVYVIDTGRVKEMQYDGMMRLVQTFASQSSCKQRRGRAGRVREGYCYRLFSRSLHEKKMSKEQTPELLRTPLEHLCLQIKSMGYEDPVAFLKNAIDAPLTDNIHTAMDILATLGAIDEAKQLTALGEHLAALPVDLKLGKMLVYGCSLQCLDPILTVAAILSYKSPFVAPLDKREEANAARSRFFTSKSDLLTDVKAFHAWLFVRGSSKKSEERRFLEGNFLSHMTLSMIRDIRMQLLNTLSDIGFVDRDYSVGFNDLSPKDSTDVYNVYASNERVVKAAITAGLYPNIVSVRHPETTYESLSHGAMAVENKSIDLRFFTKEDGRVFIHPASINFTTNKYEDLFLVYHTKLSTSKIFLRDTTMVNAMALVLFGGKLDVDHYGKVVRMDSFLSFESFPRIAFLVNGLRKLLDDILRQKIESPTIRIYDSDVVKVLLKLLVSTD